MKNQIYRVDLNDKKQIEFWICNTNAINPTIPQREVAITVLGQDGLQLDSSLDNDELESLIDYLQDAKRHCEKFNSSQIKKED